MPDILASMWDLWKILKRNSIVLGVAVKCGSTGIVNNVDTELLFSELIKIFIYQAPLLFLTDC